MLTLSRYFGILMILIVSSQLAAQSFGVKAGLNLSKFSYKDEDDNYSSEFDMNTGFHAGAFMEHSFSEALFLEVALMFETKGAAIKESDSGYEFKASINPMYISVPIMFKGKYAFSESFRMFGAAGPYLGFGFGGKTKTEETYMGDTDSDSEDINWGSDEDEDDLKPFDAGVVVGAGVEFNNFILGLYYDFGLANISPYTDDGTVVQNRVLRISAGYRFGSGATSDN